MGVPKFFRYMSERYPCLSQLVQEFEIPEIDNLYLDMNGIIHVCSHPNDFDPHFRISEQDIFSAIFHYIEFLFKTIKPQKLFFMAVDGVAPRAKMNQQRGRRFRSAKEAEVLEATARTRGEKLPEQARFDSNCITPGTVFMDRLQKQLEYFVTNKITNDPLWRDCSVILSGHETPGEGEHKIMDYIRYQKTRADYDPNIRHCLYGLDADLIMLGLCTHDPNFCLLREEVKYTKNAQKRIATPEETKFYLLHLSLMREYLDLEFQELKTSLPFSYDLEKVIDDWILMGFLVGNDFIPHLPDLHINKGALEILYKAYKTVLPTLDGFLNENGLLNLPRFQAYLTKVAEFDMENFEEKQTFTAFIEDKRRERDMLEAEYDARLANGGKPAKKDDELQKLIDQTNEQFDFDSDMSEEEEAEALKEEFTLHKSEYYKAKLEYENVTEEVLKSQAEGYIRALQWNLHYYYHGCQSWSWFYPHHYSPYVSDVTNFGNMDLSFDMGRPFLPFHQLLAVLPPASKTLLPEAYQPLMTSEDSPIIDFYPPDFATDLNGKMQEWEAVVLIPFIQENRLLSAMDKCKNELNQDEIRRNVHGPMQLFKYTKNNLGVFESDMFPAIEGHHAAVTPIWPHEILVTRDKLNMGLRPGFYSDLYTPGFPSLRFIPHTGELKHSGVKIFNFPAREKSFIITVTRNVAEVAEDVAAEWLGRCVLVGWPHMVEAKVEAVADENTRYYLKNNEVASSSIKGINTVHFNNVAGSLKSQLLEKRGININDVSVVIYACRLDGHKYTCRSDGKVELVKLWNKTEEPFPLQTTLKDIKSRPPTRKRPETIEDLYPPGDKVILLAPPNYGAFGEILDDPALLKEGMVKLQVELTTDPEINVEELVSTRDNYVSANVVCRRLSMNQGVFARVTGSCYLKYNDKKSVNIGLNLKFTKKNEETPGYTRKEGMTWLYSNKTVDLVNRYWEKFPEIFDFLNENDTMDFTLDDIYGKGQGVGKDEEITAWLKEQPHSQIKPVACGTNLLSTDAVVMLEKYLDRFRPTTTNSVIKVKTTHVYKSDMVAGNVPPAVAQHELMDRVVCCRTSYSVPIGLRGYIVGAHNGSQVNEMVYDVIFDRSFSSGISLHGCSAHRAYRMPPHAFVNITAERRTNPLLKLREMPAKSQESKPVQLWRSEPRPKTSPIQPSAFAYVSQSPTSPYPGPAAPQPIRAQNETAAANERFKAMWAELGQSNEKVKNAPVQIAKKDSGDDQSIALMQALKIIGTDKKEVSHKNNDNSAGKQVLRNTNENLVSTTDQASKRSTLLSHFERKGHGVPKYNVLPSGSELIAKVTLPSGDVCWGVPCASREDALESAAHKALSTLKTDSGRTKELRREPKNAPKPTPLMSMGAQRPLMGNFPVPPMINNFPGSAHPPFPPFNQSHQPYQMRRPPMQVYQPPQQRHIYYNSNYAPNAMRNAAANQGVPGPQWQAPSSGLPMPPFNWRNNAQSQPQPTANKIPPNLIPLQAITQQRQRASRPSKEKSVEKTVAADTPSSIHTTETPAPAQQSAPTPPTTAPELVRRKPRRIAANLKWDGE